MEYFDYNPFVDANPHKRTVDKSFSTQKGTFYYVLGRPMIKITNIDDKGFNLSSGRFSVVIYDECALLMYFAKEIELLNKGKGMLRSQNYPHIIYASTPLVGSHFYSMFEHYPESCKSWRNFENTPNNFITNSPDKFNQLMEERIEAEEMGVLYAWETENLAIPHTASGRAYKNIIECDMSTMPAFAQNPTHAGFDFHGYAEGHWWVAFHYWPDRSPKDVYILAEGNEKYREEDTADESMQFLENHPYLMGLHLTGESGGMINDPYIKASRKWGMNDVNINGDHKHDLEANILNYTIHIDKLRTPKTYDDLINAEWKDQNKFILHKEASGKKFRNHCLDCVANGLPQVQGQGIFIPNRRVREVSGVLANERRRDREANRVTF